MSERVYEVSVKRSYDAPRVSVWIEPPYEWIEGRFVHGEGLFMTVLS